MFWRKKEGSEGRLVPHRNELNRMASSLLQVADVEFDRSSELEQALVGTFFFGMLHAYGMLNRLSPPDVHALAIAVFQDTLHYSDTAAIEAVQNCIDATSPGHHETMNAILHRGIDGHVQYEKSDLRGLGANVNSVLAHFREPPQA
jgi:Immunity protein 48